MEKENQKNLTDHLITLSVLLGLLVIPMGSFSNKVRGKIRERALYKSELSGLDNRPLECSHFNHSRGFEGYNDPNNGLLVTDIEHLAYHQLFMDNPESIGLNKSSNDWAVGAILERVVTKEEPSDLIATLELAKDLWGSFFREKKDINNL